MNASTLKTILVSALLLVKPLTAYAVDIEVVEGQPDVVRGAPQETQDYRPPTTVYSSSESQNILQDRPVDTQTELLLQLQVLQTEVMELRGLVEEQGYQIQQLQQRRLDDYIDLDRRISELAGSGSANKTQIKQPNKAVSSTGGVSSSTKVSVAKVEKPAVVAEPAPQVVSNKPVTEATKPVVSKNEEGNTVIKAGDDEKGRDAYKAAYDKVKDRQFDEAKVSMVAFIGDYPKHRYAPNAYFWLGELYYHDSDFNKSKDAYSVLIDDYPEHRKVADAKFKLAKILHQEGDNKRAKSLLESVINDHGSSRVAQPARDYLENSLK